MSEKEVTVQDQHAQIGVLETAGSSEEHTSHPEAQWFPDAGLGVFLHWGISSVNGDGDLSWSMMRRAPGRLRETEARYGSCAVQRTVTPREYWRQAERFRAVNYEPRRWAEAFVAAGVRYAVLTTKHHDGFALWPSEYGDFNTRKFLGGRDLVGEFATACREAGLRVGFYYSPPDWYFDREVMSFHYGNAKPDLDIDHRPVDLALIGSEERAHHRARRREMVHGQTEELLTRYGQVDVLWFDGSADGAISLERIRELQPGIVINRRGLGAGDFETPECAFPRDRIHGWWEYCHIWNDGAWGYLSHEIYKPLGWATAELGKARAWGGNFLLNLGPNSRGELPEAAFRRLRELAEWMKVHREAVFGAEPGPWPERSNVPVTIRGNIWYLHVDYTVDFPIEISGVDAPAAVRWLHSGEAVAFERRGDSVVISLRSGCPPVSGGVIEVRWE